MISNTTKEKIIPLYSSPLLKSLEIRAENGWITKKGREKGLSLMQSPTINVALRSCDVQQDSANLFVRVMASVEQVLLIAL